MNTSPQQKQHTHLASKCFRIIQIGVDLDTTIPAVADDIFKLLQQAARDAVFNRINDINESDASTRVVELVE